MSERPPVFYARSGEAHVAYQVTGARPVDLVLTPGCISHLDLQEIRPGLPALRHAVPLSDWQQFASSSRADVRLPLCHRTRSRRSSTHPARPACPKAC
jgi:hypothetical protein